MSKMIYCPYTDTEVSEEQSSPEHIIPLSLGGDNRLIIPVDKKFNSTAGSQIDGKLANDFMMLMKRRDYDARGHSGIAPEPIMKKAKDNKTGRPIQVNLGKELKVFDMIDRKEVPAAGLEVQTTFKLDIDLPVRFLAKVALSAGYLVYGDLFRSAVAHHEVRTMMMKGRNELKESDTSSMKIRLFNPFQSKLKDEFQNTEFGLQEAICQLIKGGCIVFCPGPQNLGVFGGVLGTYLGMLNIPADTSNFPRFDDHDLGHAIIVSNGNVLRWSYRRLIARMLPEFERLQAKAKTAVNEPSDGGTKDS